MLTISDRIAISMGVKREWSIREIARSIGREPSVVSREVRRNRGVGGYVAVSADVKAEKRRSRPQERKIDADEVLARRVWSDLKAGRSPRMIAGRLRAEAQDPALPVASGSPEGHGRVVSHQTRLHLDLRPAQGRAGPSRRAPGLRADPAPTRCPGRWSWCADRSDALDRGAPRGRGGP